MPIYEYYCEDCQVEYELTRPMSKMDDPAPCATCGKEGQRQISYFSYKSTSINSANKTFNNSNLGTLPDRPFRSHTRKSTPNAEDDAPAG